MSAKSPDVAPPCLGMILEAMKAYGSDRGLRGASMTLAMVLPYLAGDEDGPNLAARIWRGLRAARGIEGLQLVDECTTVKQLAVDYFSR